MSESAARRRANNLWSEEDKSKRILRADTHCPDLSYSDLFLTLLAQHGDDFKRLSAEMQSKTTTQVASYFATNLTSLNLAKIVAEAPRRSPTPEGLREPWIQSDASSQTSQLSSPQINGSRKGLAADPLADLPSWAASQPTQRSHLYRSHTPGSASEEMM